MKVTPFTPQSVQVESVVPLQIVQEKAKFEFLSYHDNSCYIDTFLAFLKVI